MIVSMRLNLPKSNNKIRVQYNTFEKVSYDKYFIASLYLNASSENLALETINEITGKGSLNEHFQKLYNEIKLLSSSEIKAILKDSLYPIKKIDEFYYTYIPMLNISIFQNTIYKGNLMDDESFPRQLVEEGGTYINHKFEVSELVVKQDNYEVSLTNDKIEVKIGKNVYQINQTDFQSIVVVDPIDINDYKGTIANSIEGRDWMQLTRSNFNNIIDAKYYFYEVGDHIGIYNDYAKKSCISNSFGLYWVKETMYRYQDASNKDVCEKVVHTLMKSGKINEFKTKSLIELLKNSSRDYQQEVINYVLERKESKELAMIAFILVDKGYEKGWKKETLRSMYKFKETPQQLLKLYLIDTDIDYTIEDLVSIYNLNKTTLSTNHLTKVKEYYSDCEIIRKGMEEKIGKISLSGIRENLGKMPMDSDNKKFKKMLNEIMAHYDDDIKDKDLRQLKQFESRIDELYLLFNLVSYKWEHYKQQNPA